MKGRRDLIKLSNPAFMICIYSVSKKFTEVWNYRTLKIDFLLDGHTSKNLSSYFMLIKYYM